MLQLCPVIALSQIGSAAAQVNVIIAAQALSIEVAQPSVTIQMGQTSHFIMGNSSAQQPNHVKISSGSGYQVNVKAIASNFSLNGNTTTLPVNTIRVQTSIGTGSSSTPPTGLQVVPQVPLTVTQTQIVSATSGETTRGFNVTYSIPANQANSYLNRDEGTYSTTVVYTIVPQ